MQPHVRRATTSQARQFAGRVTHLDDAAITVSTDDGDLRARRAVSCLEAPREGDLVLATVLDDGRAWVLAVLDREGAGRRLSVEGDVELHVKQGALRITADEGLELATPGVLRTVAAEALHRARRVSVLADAASLVGRAVEAQVERAVTVAEHIDRTATRITERSVQAMRFVEELDQVRAGTVDWVAAKLMNLRGRHALVTAEELAKVDAGQIHLG